MVDGCFSKLLFRQHRQENRKKAFKSAVLVSRSCPFVYICTESLLSYSASALMTTMDVCCGKEYKRTTIHLIHEHRRDKNKTWKMKLQNRSRIMQITPPTCEEFTLVLSECVTLKDAF